MKKSVRPILQPLVVCRMMLALSFAAFGANATSTLARSARYDSLSGRVYEVGSEKAEFSKKGRWSARKIESTLMRLSKRRPLEVVPTGENPCTGDSWDIRHYPGGLWSEGGGHRLYGRSWTFEGGFETVFGIREGMDTSALLKSFGRPHAKGEGLFLYLTEPLKEGEEHGAESRWRIGIFHDQGKVKTLMLVAEFDDC
ncbi:MAG: hypothetical protein IPN71_24000 [Fibrobacteres bacterium]|nr:hypothetical protein [Fibrobacterota bacterium]